MKTQIHRARKTLTSLALLPLFLATPHANAAGKVIKGIEFANVQGQSLKLDLYLPAKPEGSGLMIWIHGGGWRGGSREKCFINWLPEHGYSVASISYRLSGVAKFPAQLHDCKGAVRWLRANASRYGYDPNKIFVAGASAGGHLTALMATTSGHKLLEGRTSGNLDQSSSILAAIDYYGATDFILRSKTQPSRANKKGSVVYDLLGGGAHEKVAAAKLASACYHVSKDDRPLLIFHGTNDKTVLIDQSQAIEAKYKKAGLSIKFHAIRGAGHGGDVFYSGENAKRLLKFLGEQISRQETTSTDSARPDDWGTTTNQKAEFYAASDVPKSQVELTKQWHEIATKAWGNYGPLEFWIVGKSEATAKILDRKYCDIRKQKDPSIPLRHCLNRGHNFVSYARGGNAGLNTRRNENEKWSGFIITMSAKFPGPKEEDYKSVVLHEYFHVYQHAHIHSRIRSERESLHQKNPWWGEGGAEYMAQLLYSRQKGVRAGYLKEKMKRKLRSLKDLKDGESIQDIPYGKRVRIAYDLGAWFIAFIIGKTSEEAYRVKFYKDLNTKGFEGSFVKNFGFSSKDLLDEFHNNFLKLNLSDKMKIIP